MKAWLGVSIACLLAVLSAMPAFAGPGDGFGQGRRHGGWQGGARFMDRDMERAMRQQEFRREPPREMPMFGRMSPEERRQFRRDIRDAGDDLYRRPPPEGPPRGF